MNATSAERVSTHRPIAKRVLVSSVLLIAACGIGMIGAAQQDALPPAQLKARLDLSSFAPAGSFDRAQMQFGDLDGNGSATDFIRYTNSKRMQAFAFNGSRARLLWEYVAPEELKVPAPPDRYHYKYAIWDVDGDGRSEVIGPFAAPSGKIEMRVLEGRTGTVKAAREITPLVNPTKDDNVTETRLKVSIANFRGLETPRDIVLLSENDSNGDIWAFEGDLKPLWDTTADNAEKRRIYAHYPWLGDLDGDGKDDLAGTFVMNHEGKRQFRTTLREWWRADVFYDHLDRAFIGDFDPNRPGAELIASHEFGEALMFNAKGEVYLNRRSSEGDAKIITVGDLTTRNPGVEILFLDPKDRENGQLLNLEGKLIGKAKLPFVDFDGFPMDWDGDRSTDEVFETTNAALLSVEKDSRLVLRENYNADAKTKIEDGVRVFAAPLDILGDHREEIVLWDNDEVLIYGARGNATRPYSAPWRDAAYRLAVANGSYDNHPERASLDFRLLGYGGKKAPRAADPTVTLAPPTPPIVMQPFPLDAGIDPTTPLARVVMSDIGKLRVRALPVNTPVPSGQNDALFFSPPNGARGVYTIILPPVAYFDHRVRLTFAEEFKHVDTQLTTQGFARLEATQPAADAKNFVTRYARGGAEITVTISVTEVRSDGQIVYRVQMELAKLVAALG
jgi:hypothetical protein